MSGKDRVLLVEFIAADQFPGQIFSIFPAVKGALAAQGVPAAWLRFAVPADNQFRHGRDEVTLEPEELAALEAKVDAFAANAVFTSHLLFRGQREALLSRAGLRLDVWSLSSPPVLAVLAAAGVAVEAPRDPFDGARGDYLWEAGNAAAGRADRNNVYLDTGAGCGYHKPVASNPCYAGVELPPGAKIFGCSFCGFDRTPRPAGPSRAKALVRRQLEDIRRTLGPGRLPGAVVVENVARPGLLAFTLRELRRLKMIRTVLLAAARVDHLVGLRPALERLLSGLRGREALHVHTTGVENFSDPELRRFNKGFDSLAAVRGVNLLKELEVRYPRNFHYSGYMPLGFILFSPWTRLENLRRNLRLIQHLELEYEAGNLFMSRLRLHPAQAATALAERDGLLAPTAEKSLRLNRRKLFGYERPWRFADPRVEPVNRLAVRLEANGSFSGDPLYEKIRERLRDADRRGLVSALLALVDAAGRHPGPQSPESLLEEALGGAASRPAAPPAPVLRALPLPGVPACCARAWARRRRPRTPPDGWDRLVWRLKIPGPVPPELALVLAPELSFLPCSADCRLARKTRSRWLKARGIDLEPGRAFLFSLTDERQVASFIPLGQDPREIRYDPAAVGGAPGTLREALRRGDRALLLPGQVEIRRGTRLLACWVAEAAVWDPRGGLDAPMWEELALAAFRRRDRAWLNRAARAAAAGRGLALDRPTAEGRAPLRARRPPAGRPNQTPPTGP